MSYDEQEVSHFLGMIKQLERKLAEAQRKLEECQNSIHDFVMEHRDDIELHMEDYELLEPVLNQILESEKPREGGEKQE